MTYLIIGLILLAVAMPFINRRESRLKNGVTDLRYDLSDLSPVLRSWWVRPYTRELCRQSNEAVCDALIANQDGLRKRGAAFALLKMARTLFTATEQAIERDRNASNAVMQRITCAETFLSALKARDARCLSLHGRELDDARDDITAARGHMQKQNYGIAGSRLLKVEALLKQVDHEIEDMEEDHAS